MNWIKSMHIEGFKKFERFDINFNEHMNILVGENEAGKSTILDAIKIVLNQQYRYTDKAILKDLFNVSMQEKYKNNKSLITLPYIIIDLELEMDSKDKNAQYYYGEMFGNLTKTKHGKYGIRFECKLDKELENEVQISSLNDRIPYEYYLMSWTTFAGSAYHMIKRPLSFIAIDTSNNYTSASFNYYNKTLFLNKYEEKVRMSAKNTFGMGLEKAFETLKLEPISDNRKFGVDSKKVVLEQILSIYENDIALENRGRGMESIIKTELALEQKACSIDVILMEEPENHLSFLNMQKMLNKISDKINSAQMIIATHSNMIASRLNLKNVLWITENKVETLKLVDEKIAKFFAKADDNNFLQLLLSEKTILVEGKTEYLLIPLLYKQLTGHSILEDRISIISCNGISYKNYLEIAKATRKKIAVITDNDEKQKKIDEANDFNSQNSNQHIFMDKDIKKWTWEVCLYALNNKLLDGLIKTQNNGQYTYNGKQIQSKTLGKMLNTKAESAYEILEQNLELKIPEYVKEAISWLKK